MTITIAALNSCFSRSSRSRICAWTVTSSAVVGSSAISRSGFSDERHRDHRPLAHAARELVRVLVARVRRGAGSRRAAASRRPAREPPSSRPSGAPGRPRRSGRRPCSRDAASVIGSWKIIQIFAPRTFRISSTGSVSRSCPWKMISPSMIGLLERDQAHHREERHALAGARLAHDAERLAREQRERDAVDGLHQAVLGGEVHREVLDLEERFRHLRCTSRRRVEERVGDVDAQVRERDEERRRTA